MQDELAEAMPWIDEQTEKRVSQGMWDAPGYKVRFLFWLLGAAIVLHGRDEGRLTQSTGKIRGLGSLVEGQIFLLMDPPFLNEISKQLASCALEQRDKRTVASSSAYSS